MIRAREFIAVEVRNSSQASVMGCATKPYWHNHLPTDKITIHIKLIYTHLQARLAQSDRASDFYAYPRRWKLEYNLKAAGSTPAVG